MASHYPTDLQVVVMCQETQENASKDREVKFPVFKIG